MKKLTKRIIAIVSAVAMVVTMLPQTGMTYAAEPVEVAQSTKYEIYPIPHEITYAGSNFEMTSEVNVVYETGIDADTKARLDEVLELQDMTGTTSEAVQTGVLNILVGINDSDGYVDKYVDTKYANAGTLKDGTKLYEELDSYYLVIDNGTIVVLGKDTDAAFYGLTSLYHIFTQVENGTIENLEMKDYADVASRGFIEGYYGNPWSTEDRCNLMEWGGYYKLNSYFYAPKDDPKHNSKWKELYTPEEIETKIKPLAEAGNKSKCRFVYALHPYMHNAIRYSSDAAYEEDMNIMKAKFTQVIEAGVRQIAILADDAGNVGGTNYIRTLTDMTAWIKEMQKTYPDLKLLLPFCTQEYMYNGESYYSDFPENIQIVMTGGRIWGECSTSYTTTFMNNVGRGVYLWINWPCTDNSKQHLIMGGYSTFLHPGVDPDKVQGIVLNPMQQSEPSKVAIFGNACYTWNIWETTEEADQAWEDSFDHVDHKSYKETEGSNALKELSKHMMNQNMDSRVTALQESVVLKEELNSFKDALEAGTVTKEAVDSLIEEFEILQNASVTYRNKAGDANTRDQIVYWLNCWDDTTAAAIAYLNAINAYLAGNDSVLIEQYFAGQSAYASSKTYGFHYVDHTEYAEVGVQHIVPFIKEVGTFLATEIKLLVDPSAIVQKWIGSEKYSTPATGSIDNILDGNDNTNAIFKTPNEINAGDYIGVSYNRGITINDLYVLMGGGRDHFFYAKFQYLLDVENAEWTDIPDATFTKLANDTTPYEVTGLNLTNVKAVRLITTADNGVDAWTEVKSFDVNKKAAVSDTETTEEAYTGTISYDGVASKSGEDANLLDNDPATEVMLAKSPYEGDDRDTFPAGASIILTFAEAKTVGRVEFYQGASKAGDVLSDAKLQYKLNGTDTWVDAGNITNATEQTITLGNVENVIAIRIYNNTSAPVWARIGGIKVYAPTVTKLNQENVYTSVETTISSKKLEDKEGIELTEGTVTLGSNDYIGIKFAHNEEIENVAVDYDELHADVKLQASKNGIIWTDIISGVQNDLQARYIRLVNTGNTELTLDVKQFEAEVAEFGKKLHSCDVAVQWGGDTRESMDVFDGKMGTSIKIDGGPLAGQSIVYDLGQNFDIHSLRIYVIDSEHNYIRDAVVQVSSNLSTWTDLFEIGDGVTAPYEEGFNSTPRESFPNNDSNYPNYVWVGSDELDASGRYLRILFTADCTYRGAAMNEIMINGGEYVSVESNKDFSGTLEVQDHLPSYMADGDLLTSYKASKESGSMTYHITEGQDKIKALRIVQNGIASGAKVTMSLYDGANVTEVEVGTLSEVMTGFNIPEGKTLLAITVEWKEINKTALEEVVAASEALKAEEYTTASFTALKKALNAVGQMSAIPEIAEVIKCETTVEESDVEISWEEKVNESVEAITNAMNALVKRGNKAELENIIATVKELKAADYTSASWSAVRAALTEAKAVNANVDATQSEVDAAVAALDTAVKALVKAEVTPDQPGTGDQPSTPDQPGTGDKPSTPDQPGTGDQPSTPDKPGTTIADKTALASAITAAEAIEAYDYTDATWKAFQTALEAAKTVNAKADATQSEVDAAVAALETAVKNLVKDYPTTDPVIKPLKKGSKFIAGSGAIYKVTKLNGKTGEASFVSDKNVKNVIIPATVKEEGITFKVTAIEKNAFKNNKKVAKITGGKNVVTIGANAFQGCTALTKVTIGTKVTTIGAKAFYGCSKLTAITIPKNVKKLGASLFTNCKKLKTITIKSTKLTKSGIAKGAFKGLGKSTKIKVPAKSLKAYKTLFKSKGLSTKVKVTK